MKSCEICNRSLVLLSIFLYSLNMYSAQVEGLLPDGRSYVGSYVVGEPSELNHRHSSMTNYYSLEKMEQAVDKANEIIRRYESSASIASNKESFFTPTVNCIMSDAYAIQAENYFTARQMTNATIAIETALKFRPSNLHAHVIRSSVYTAKMTDFCLPVYDAYIEQANVEERFQYYKSFKRTGWLYLGNVTTDYVDIYRRNVNTNEYDPIVMIDEGGSNKVVYIRCWYGLNTYTNINHKEISTAKLRLQEEQKEAVSFLKDYDVLFKSDENAGEKIIQAALHAYNIYPEMHVKFKKNDGWKSRYSHVCCFLSQYEMSRENYSKAMAYLNEASSIYHYENIDFLSTVISLLMGENMRATTLMLKYKRLPKTVDRRMYFEKLIKTGYFGQMDQSDDFCSAGQKKGDTFWDEFRGVPNPVRLKMVMQATNAVIINGESIMQWTGMRKSRWEPYGTLRQRSWNVSSNYVENPLSDFPVDFLDLQVETQALVLVSTKYGQRVFQYYPQDTKHEPGWYDFDTGKRGTNVFIKTENILWFNGETNSLRRFTPRGMVSLETISLPFLSSVNVHVLTNSIISSTEKDNRLGTGSVLVSEMRRKHGLVAVEKSDPITVSNSVIFVLNSGKPVLAQLCYVDGKKRYAQWLDPATRLPSDIPRSAIQAVFSSFDRPDFILRVQKTTVQKSIDFALYKVQSVLSITANEFDDDKWVYLVSALIIFLVLVVLGRITNSLLDKALMGLGIFAKIIISSRLWKKMFMRCGVDQKKELRSCSISNRLHNSKTNKRKYRSPSGYRIKNFREQNNKPSKQSKI